jgi:hypothetical protein
MTASGEFDTSPVRAFLPGPDLRVDESVWPASVPALAQVLRDGLELPAGLTVLVGENGSGKSTVVETLAEAYGLNPQGGSALGQVPGNPPHPGGPDRLLPGRTCSSSPVGHPARELGRPQLGGCLAAIHA